MAPTSLLADTVSPVVYTISSPSLFLNLQPSLTVHGLVSLFSGNPLLKFLWSQCFLASQVFSSYPPPTNLKDCSILAYPIYCVCNFCSRRCNAKTCTNLFFFFHYFLDSRFILRSLQPQHVFFFSLSLLSWEHLLFKIKGVLYGFGTIEYPASLVFSFRHISK
jgi:hypothetical protein